MDYAEQIAFASPTETVETAKNAGVVQIHKVSAMNGRKDTFLVES